MHVATAHLEEWALVIENLVATNGTLSEATRLFGKLRTISVKSNFVTSCLSFRGSILARKWLRMLEEENGPECLTKKWLSMPN